MATTSGAVPAHTRAVIAELNEVLPLANRLYITVVDSGPGDWKEAFTVAEKIKKVWRIAAEHFPDAYAWGLDKAVKNSREIALRHGQQQPIRPSDPELMKEVCDSLFNLKVELESGDKKPGERTEVSILKTKVAELEGTVNKLKDRLLDLEEARVDQRTSVRGKEEKSRSWWPL
jgi:hypothetical protein